MTTSQHPPRPVEDSGRDPQRAAGLFTRWWRGQGALPTTVAGVEVALVAIFLLVRLTDLVQLAIATPQGLHRSTRPGVDTAAMVLYVLESMVIAVALIRARRFLRTLWATVELLTAAAIILAQPLFTTDADRVGTWVAWGYAIGVGTSVAVGIGYPRRWQSAVGVTVLICCYLIVSLPAAARFGSSGTVWSNGFGFIGFGMFGRGAAGYLRRLGRDADAARKLAADTAAEAMFNRQRNLLHDQAGVLRQLARPSDDPLVQDLLRARAASAALQIRQWLSATPTVDLHEPTTLIGITQRVIADAHDLAITASLDLATGVTLDPRAAEALRGALTTVLDNVREHARAEEVLVHADVDSTGRWELSIRDDGIGFRHDWATVGFGLGQQVRNSLQRVGVQVRIESSVGEGTCVTISGHTAGAAAPR